MKAINSQPPSLEWLLRLLWSAVGAGALILMGVTIWTPNVSPVMPSRAALAQEKVGFEVTNAVQSEGAFVARPLFLSDRRPGASGMSALVESVPVAPSDEKPRRVEGVTLLGVFSSDGVAGVIVAEKGAGQRRIFEGDTLQGWTLVDVEPRAAVFSDGDRTARVDMTLLSGLPAPTSSGEARDNAVAAEGGSSATAPEETPSFVPTFDNMYKSKARSAESKRQSDEVGAQQTQKGEKDDGK
jgi:hypothetical protein